MENFPNDDPQNPYDEQKPDIIPTISPLSAAISGLVAIFILYQIGGGLITLIIFGFDLENADINALRLMQAAGQILFILLPALIFSKMVYEDVTTILRIKLPNIKEVIIFSAGMILIIPLLQSYLYIQNYILLELASSFPVIDKLKSVFDQLDQMMEQTYTNLLTQESIVEAIFIIFVVAVVPSICEELFFRGFVQKSFEFKLRPITAALITAIFFGMYHFNPYGLIALIALGAYFGFASYMSNSIVIPVILHFINNFFAVFAFFIFGNEDFMESKVVDPTGINSYIISFIILLILFSVVIYYIKNNYHKFSTNPRRQNDMPEM